MYSSLRKHCVICANVDIGSESKTRLRESQLIVETMSTVIESSFTVREQVGVPVKEQLGATFSLTGRTSDPLTSSYLSPKPRIASKGPR